MKYEEPIMVIRSMGKSILTESTGLSVDENWNQDSGRLDDLE